MSKERDCYYDKWNIWRQQSFRSDDFNL